MFRLAAAEIHNRANRSIFHSFLSEALVEVGDPAEAARVADTGLRGARERKERAEEAWCLRALAEALRAVGRSDADAAESSYRNAMAIAAELGMRPLVAHCNAGLAKLFRRTGKRTQSDAHFTTATTMYRDMGMTYWLERTQRELES